MSATPNRHVPEAGKELLMKLSDRHLGMNREITRRDVIRGVGVISAGMVLPGSLFGCAESAPEMGLPIHPL